MGSEMLFLVQTLVMFDEIVLWEQLDMGNTKLLCETVSLQVGKSAIGASCCIL